MQWCIFTVSNMVYTQLCKYRATDVLFPEQIKENASYLFYCFTSEKE